MAESEPPADEPSAGKALTRRPAAIIAGGLAVVLVLFLLPKVFGGDSSDDNNAGGDACRNDPTVSLLSPAPAPVTGIERRVEPTSDAASASGAPLGRPALSGMVAATVSGTSAGAEAAEFAFEIDIDDVATRIAVPASRTSPIAISLGTAKSGRTPIGAVATDATQSSTSLTLRAVWNPLAVLILLNERVVAFYERNPPGTARSIAKPLQPSVRRTAGASSAAGLTFGNVCQWDLETVWRLKTPLKVGPVGTFGVLCSQTRFKSSEPNGRNIAARVLNTTDGSAVRDYRIYEDLGVRENVKGEHQDSLRAEAVAPHVFCLVKSGQSATFGFGRLLWSDQADGSDLSLELMADDPAELGDTGMNGVETIR